MVGKTYPVAGFLRENGKANQDEQAVHSGPAVKLDEELEILFGNNPTDPMENS